MRVFHHLYVSHAAREFDERELALIADEIADGYKQVGITGMMLYGCGMFIELIEGDPHYVEFVMESIRTDDRHTKVTTITTGKTPKRVFQDWTMHVLNVGFVGRDELMTDAMCLHRYLNFVRDTEVSKRTVAGMKYFRERVIELPSDPSVYAGSPQPETATPEGDAAPAGGDGQAPIVDTSTPGTDAPGESDAPAKDTTSAKAA